LPLHTSFSEFFTTKIRNTKLSSSRPGKMDQYHQQAPAYTTVPNMIHTGIQQPASPPIDSKQQIVAQQQPVYNQAQLYTSDPNMFQGNIQQPQPAVYQDKQQFVQQQQAVGAPRANQYQNATPLASLQQYPAPIDCPVCGVREMTIVTLKIGGYTQ
jgi:hypothetical protein